MDLLFGADFDYGRGGLRSSASGWACTWPPARSTRRRWRATARARRRRAGCCAALFLVWMAAPVDDQLVRAEVGYAAPPPLLALALWLIERSSTVRGMTHEAKIEETDTGKQPADDGWFILNAADIGWSTVPGGGTWCSFESPGRRSKLLGIGIHYLPPGETPGFYHEEDDQEGFLVLTGECLLVVEGEERRDAARGTTSTARPAPTTSRSARASRACAILMVGTRVGDARRTTRPIRPRRRHGAAVAEATESTRARPTRTARRSSPPARRGRCRDDRGRPPRRACGATR